MRTLILAAALPLMANEPPTPAEWVMEGVCLGLQLADWGTTLDMVNHNPHSTGFSDQTQHGVKEVNPLLPYHPTRAQVNLLNALGMATHFAAFWYSPHDARKAILVADIVLQGLAVRGNLRLGLRVRF